MKKTLLVLIAFASMSGVAHAAQVTDCSVQNAGVPCIIPSTGQTGSCQLTYDMTSMTCDVTKSGVAGTVTTQASPAQTQTTQPAAQGFTALAPIPGLTDTSATSVINSATLASFFNNLYKYLIGLAATLAVIQIIWAGIEIAMNRDNASKLLDEKGKIYNAIFGLILVLSPALIFSIINPSILNLSLDLPPIKPMTTGPALTPGGGTFTGTGGSGSF